MALNYDAKFRWSELSPVLDEHTEWFHDFLNFIFYSDVSAATGGDVVRPVTFMKWIDFAKVDKGVPSEVVDQLIRLHNDLFAHADVLLNHARQTRQRPDFVSFEEFMKVYEAFLLGLRRLEKDLIHEDIGYDPFTGLRNPSNLVSDYEREMSRLRRQGKGFCLAIARIDNFSEIEQHYPDEQSRPLVKLVSDLIKLSIRSFDDAYHMGRGEFVLCLKQTSVSGGFSALERLRRELEVQDIMLDLGTRQMEMSMSCCIAEPVDGDDVHDLLDYLRKDLESTGKRTDRVLEYFELSPLQRYVQTETQQ